MSAKLKKTAQELASKGRYGDTMLLHVNPIEVAGIASLVPGGRLPINPHTGLPEAFWFLGPLLAGLFGAAAPAAAATGLAASAAPAALAQGAATAAGTAGALGAGAGAAAPGFLGTLGSIGSGLMKGIGSLFGAGGGAGAAGAGGAAAAGLPVGMEAGLSTALPVGVDAMTTGAIPAAATAGGNTGIAALQAAGASPASILPQSTAIPAMGAEISTALPLGPVAPISATPANVLANPAGQSFAGTGVATGGPASPAPWAGLRDVTSGANATTGAGYFPPAPGAPGKGLFGGISDLVGKLPGGIMPWAIGAQMLGGLFKGGGGGGGSKEEEGDDVEGGDYDYAGGEADFPDEGYEPGIDAEHNYYPQQKKMRMYANGGLVRGYAQGGMVDPQMQMPDMDFPQNGIGSLMSPEQIPQSPFPTSQIGSEPEPSGDDIPAPTDNDKELIAQTVEAIRGTIPNPEQIMLAFVKEFGEQALQDLMMRVQGMGAMENNGQSDSIPAMIDGQQPAALSEGEYVIPADAVSGMGNGSTAAGAQQLDSLVGNVRQARTGSQAQPPMLNAGGLVSLYGR